MLKVFLVEDEVVVREGIKKIIDWKSHGYDFCGEASDGELALPMIEKLQPDIIISDIKMPFMDGLELSKRIKKEFPWMEIIVLSGYEEFEYAKKAIKIGVAEYLTKPINGEALLEEVDALAVKIEEKRKERENKEKYEKEMEENSKEEQKKLFQSLVTGSQSVTELLEMGDNLGVDLSAMWYNIVLLMVQSTNHTQEEYSNRIVEIDQQLNMMCDGSKIIWFDRNLEGKAFVVKADTKEELDDTIEHYLNQMKEIVSNYNHVRYFGGVGEAVNRLRELPVSFEKANHAFAHRYLGNESEILYSNQLEKTVETEAFDFSHVDLKQINREKMTEFLKFGNQEEVVYFVEEFFKNLDRNAIKSNLFQQYIVMDTYFSVAEFVESLQFSKEEIEQIPVSNGGLNSAEGVIGYIERIVKQALELREKSASNRYGDVVDEVMHYIEQNYADEELSLNMIASHVNFSPNHLSTVFSQQTGQTFIKYLTDYRMNKAKELLHCTGKKSSSICQEVGYKDPHYFSYLFKKTQGMTPTQYRGGGNAEGEE